MVQQCFELLHQNTSSVDHAFAANQKNSKAPLPYTPAGVSVEEFLHGPEDAGSLLVGHFHLFR